MLELNKQSSQLKLEERIELLSSRVDAIKREITRDLKINFKATTIDPETKQTFQSYQFRQINPDKEQQLYLIMLKA